MTPTTFLSGKWAIAAILLALSSASAAVADNATMTPTPPLPMSSNGQVLGNTASVAASDAPLSAPSANPAYSASWPAPGEDAHRYDNPYAANAGVSISQNPYASAAMPKPESTMAAAGVPTITVGPPEKLSESTLYVREEAFFWHESIGDNNVDESGPLTTLGYMHRNGCERWRMELFGGSMNYDGFAQYDDGSTENYSQSSGTNYLGLRGEYELLIEPTCWDFLRFSIGLGTRFWIRDLKDSVTPSGSYVSGYQECWWTFYPYIGLETRESSEPGIHFYGSMRVGFTPLTYESIAYYGLALYPRCGMTAQAELGIRYNKCVLAATVETMTWGESAVVQDSYQPESSMLTVGGKFSFTF
jgi:hypothetical protein